MFDGQASGGATLFSNSDQSNLLDSKNNRAALQKFIRLAVKLTSEIERMKHDPSLQPFFIELVETEGAVDKAQHFVFNDQLEDIIKRCNFAKAAKPEALIEFKAKVTCLYENVLKKTINPSDVPGIFELRLNENIDVFVRDSVQQFLPPHNHL